MFEIILNVAGAYLTSILSAIIGMGGGITLLAIMLLTMDLAVVIPIHGVVQLASNSSRWVLFFSHINWPIIRRFAVGLIPFSFLGILLVDYSNPTYLKIFIGAFILIVVYAPLKKLRLPHQDTPAFFLAGALSGTVAMIAGATGPLIAPFFLHRELVKETIIATKATCQAITHFVKIALFGVVLQFNFLEHGVLIVSMVIAVVIGTWTGKQILTRYVSEIWFIRLYKTVLTIVGLKLLIYDGLGTWIHII